jgi:hypothetical protein
MTADVRPGVNFNFPAPMNPGNRPGINLPPPPGYDGPQMIGGAYGQPIFGGTPRGGGSGSLFGGGSFTGR